MAWNQVDYNDSVYREGDQGDPICDIQRYLDSCVTYTTVDGQFGAGTRHGVELFQGQAMCGGINCDEIDGQVGPKTWAAMEEGSGAFAYGHLIPWGCGGADWETKDYGDILRFASKGDPVCDVQRFLYILKVDYIDVPISGYYNVSTVYGVEHFQRANGLLVDGEVGPNTWAMMEAGPGALEHIDNKGTRLTKYGC